MISCSSNYSVYMHEVKTTKEKYIGITCQKPIYRWGHNGHNYKCQPKFYNAIQKYGWENFNHIILNEHLNIYEALNLEEKYIQQYDCINNGFNISSRGEVGYTKQVRCITTNMLYNSVSEAAEAVGVHSSSLSHCLHGDWNTCGQIDDIRLEWSFVIDAYNEDASIKYEERIKKQEQLILQKEKEINLFIKEYCDNNMTITNIAKKYGTSKQKVSAILKEQGIKILSNKKPVAMYDKNWNYIKEFESTTEALKYLNKTDSDTSRIKKACEEDWRIYKGYHWKYVINK